MVAERLGGAAEGVGSSWAARGTLAPTGSGEIRLPVPAPLLVSVAVDEELFSSPWGLSAAAPPIRSEQEKATPACLLGRVPVPRGLSTLSASEAHNKGSRGMLLDVLIPEERRRVLRDAGWSG